MPNDKNKKVEKPAPPTDDVKMPLTSMSVTDDKLRQLRDVFPEVFAEGKVDFDKLRAVLGENVETGRERYGLSWAGKAEALRNLQALSVGTLLPCPEESVNWDTTENLFIEGDNLEVLKLLQKSYYGKVKMIYIDPPYNTGGEFIYPDNYREGLDDYLRYSGQVDGEGLLVSTNKETEGRFHSKWLTMMYPRLFLAKNLLQEDGVIFASIDENEAHNLHAMMNEIFGEENFISRIVWEKRFTRSNNAKTFTTLTESIFLFRKSSVLDEMKEPRTLKSDSIYTNPDNDPRGAWTSVSYVNPATKEQRPNLVYPIINPVTGKTVMHPSNAWKYERKTHEQHVKENKLYWGQKGENSYPRLKKFLSEMEGGMVPVDLWKHEETGTTDQASKQLDEIFGAKVFEFPKPHSLVTRMLRITAEPKTSDIILDFFAGSGTTAHAVLELNKKDGGNRKFILVQLPEPLTGTRVAGGGIRTIADIGKERIRRVIKQLNAEDKGKLPDPSAKPQDRGFRVFKLSRSNFKIWDADKAPQDPEKLKTELRKFSDNLFEGRTSDDILYEIILKYGLPSSLTLKIEKTTVGGKEAFSIADGLLLVCLENPITKDVLRAVAKMKNQPQRFVCLDTAFAGNDQLKTNTVLEMKSHGIEFRTV